MKFTDLNEDVDQRRKNKNNRKIDGWMDGYLKREKEKLLNISKAFAQQQ